MKTHEAIKTIMIAYGIKQTQMARDLKISRITVSRYVNGHSDVPAETFLKILEYLDLGDLSKTSYYLERFATVANGVVIPRARLEGRA